jgi:copper chaperone CopZ
MVIEIQGMSCQHCVAAVRDILQGLQGVQGLEVEMGRATLSGTVSFAEVSAALAEDGYSATQAE